VTPQHARLRIPMHLILACAARPRMPARFHIPHARPHAPVHPCPPHLRIPVSAARTHRGYTAAANRACPPAAFVSRTHMPVHLRLRIPAASVCASPSASPARPRIPRPVLLRLRIPVSASRTHCSYAARPASPPPPARLPPPPAGGRAGTLESPPSAAEAAWRTAATKIDDDTKRRG
jgi:hypothetical protein